MRTRTILIILTTFIAIMLSGCKESPTNTERPVDSASPTPIATEQPQPTAIPESTDDPSQPEDTFDNPRDAAAAVIETLKESDWERLKAYIHPSKGILFSPYGHIDADHAITFSSDELPTANADTSYVWGSYDGSGEPIQLTFGEYYKKFVYDKDFANPEQVGYDKIISQGNTEPNIKDVFPEGYSVEYYFSGFDKEFAGMDWASLILVLEEVQGNWYVCAVVHSQWTI
ncbi:hypothetical protein ACX1C1_01130 [Paenibacillus sp. strain BS8-2]